MMEIEEVIRQLSASAQAMRALLENVPEEQAQWKPGPESWSLQEVMGHIYNEERLDFRKHLKEMLSDPPQAWGLFQPEDQAQVTSLRQALAGFLSEREDSLAWLKTLEAPDWKVISQAPWRPIGAGEVLVSWHEHDYLHLRQINELLHGWNEQQGAPYSVAYGGGW